MKDIIPEKLMETVIGWASPLLLCLGVVYAVYGGHKLFTEAGDFRTRWIEEHYVFEGKNPIDIFDQAQASAKGESFFRNGRDASIDPQLGPTQVGGYPPWAYFTGAILTWPSHFEVARFFYGIVNLVVLGGLFFWAYRLGGAEDATLGLFLAASLLAVNSICTSFIVGQYGVIVLAALVAAALYDKRGNWFLSGFWLAVAMIKVTIAGPFILPFVIKARWRTLTVTGGYLLFASLVIWPVIKTSPVEMLEQMVRSSGSFQEMGYNLSNLLEFLGMVPQSAGQLAGIGCPLLAMILLYFWRHSSMLTLYAIAALAARAWCYHRLYDNLILAFILLDLGIVAWKMRNGLGWGTYILLGLTLWMPGRLADFHSWMITQWCMWVIGLAVLLYLRRSELVSFRQAERCPVLFQPLFL